MVAIEVVDVGSDLGNPARRAAALDLERALRTLTADERALLAMRHLGGFDSREIGEALGLSPEAVRTRLSRLVARLRAALSDDRPTSIPASPSCSGATPSTPSTLSSRSRSRRPPSARDGGRGPG